MTVHTSKNEILCLTPEFVEKYHDEIVTRWNAHDALVAALQKIKNFHRDDTSPELFYWNAVNTAKAALASAGVKAGA